MAPNGFYKISFISITITLVFATPYYTYISHVTTGKLVFLSVDFINTSLLTFLYLYFTILRVVVSVVIPLIFIIKLFSSKGDFMDDWFLFHIREHKEFYFWAVIILFLTWAVFFCLLVYASYFTKPETVGIIIKGNWITFLSLSLAFLFIYTLLFVAKIKEPPKLSSALASEISEKLIVREPDSAVRKAFIVFEDKLRQKVGVDDEFYGEELINSAFGVNKGKLMAYEQENKRTGIRNLMSGTFAIYRNSIMHHEMEPLDKNTAIMLLTLIDEFVKIVDKSEVKNESEQS